MPKTYTYQRKLYSLLYWNKQDVTLVTSLKEMWEFFSKKGTINIVTGILSDLKHDPNFTKKAPKKELQSYSIFCKAFRATNNKACIELSECKDSIYKGVYFVEQHIIL